MNYDVKHTGYVYKCICLVTNKVYVGITTETIEKRKGRHIRESFNSKSQSYHYHFHRAIRKYGPEQFEWSQLECITSNSRENLIYCLKQLEVKYISLFDSYNSGYNSTIGGDDSSLTKREVNVFLKDGTKINQFESIQDAADYYNVSRNSVGKCCNGIQKYVRSTDFGMLIFKFKSYVLTQKDLDIAVKTKKANKIRVGAYYMDTGEFIKEFESFTEAEQFFNLSNNTISGYFRKKGQYAGIYNERKLIWKKRK